MGGLAASGGAAGGEDADALLGIEPGRLDDHVPRRDLTCRAPADGAPAALIAAQVAELERGEQVDLDLADGHAPVGTDGIPGDLVAEDQGVEAVLDRVAVTAGDRDVGIADADAGDAPEILERGRRSGASVAVTCTCASVPRPGTSRKMPRRVWRPKS